MVWEYVFNRIWDVSGLTLYDRAALSASFYYYWDDRVNCQRALALLKHRPDFAQAEKVVRTRFGCDTVSDKPRLTIDGIGYHTCLCKVQHPLFYAYLELNDRLDKGVLPDKGAYMDQPSQLLEALNLLNRLKNEAQVAEAKQNDKKAAKHGRK